MTATLALVLRILLLVLAYLFVGWIGYTILKDLQALLHQRNEMIASPITLHIIDTSEPIEKQFVKREVIIGRDPDCDFIITDETISLRHCKLVFHHKQWWANDLNSTNGSFINDSPIDSAVVLTEGDILRLGKVLISINFNQ
jgi:pSer/pThr/pTyr-binding forkhead associated (FHA) protein